MGGVVCQTLLHPAVNMKHFLPFAADCLGSGDLAEQFNAELRQQCKAAFMPSIWASLFTGYSGSWNSAAIAPLDNAIFASLGEWLNQNPLRQEIVEASDGNKTARHDLSHAGHPFG